jgi:hypothetical protein
MMMRSPARVLFVTTAVACLLVLPACREGTELEPPETGPFEPMDEQATREMAGVRMTVDGDAWPGDVRVKDLVTPIKLDIDNASGRPLRIRFSNFALLGAYDRYSVLPLFTFERVGDRYLMVEGYAPVALPEFSYEEYYVTEQYRPAFPGIATYDRALVLDDAYYGRYMRTWEELPLPIDDMRKRGLPEGVLPADSSLSGFLFFEGLHPGEEKLHFLAQLQDAETHDYFGAIRITLLPEGPVE